jgi:hypothetical protein
MVANHALRHMVEELLLTTLSHSPRRSLMKKWLMVAVLALGLVVPAVAGAATSAGGGGGFCCPCCCPGS